MIFKLQQSEAFLKTRESSWVFLLFTTGTLRLLSSFPALLGSCNPNSSPAYEL